MISLFVILFAIFFAIIAPLMAPDQTPNANDQVLEITNERPGFTIDMLTVRKNRQVRHRNFLGVILFGKDNPYSLVPVNSFQIDGRKLIAEVYRGERYASSIDTFDLVDIVYALSIADFNIRQNGDRLLFTDYYENEISTTVGELQAAVQEKHITRKTYRLGTDKFGRDILSRLMFGLRVSISVGFIAVFISLFIGISIGATAGYFRNDKIRISRASVAGAAITSLLLLVKLFLLPNWKVPVPGISFLTGLLIVLLIIYAFRTLLIRIFRNLAQKIFFPYDDLAMWVINVVWSIPTILLAMALSFALGTWLESFWVIYIAVGLSMWVEVARIVRGQVMGVRELEYVQAARGLGYNNARIIVRHILPNIIGPIMVIMAANFAAAILIEAGLSFIGIGVQPPMPSWGVMLSENRNYLKVPGKAFLALAPGISIMILVLAFNLLGNGLRDAFDVKGRET
jgi:ABC-type dipeptide/oligopeptide/nickel transport system permease subunit